VFVHLGDYVSFVPKLAESNSQAPSVRKIYETTDNGEPIGRAVLGRELATIHDYRQRLGQYRSDPDLQAAHLNHPWITVW
jgi:phosphodiesterase/alkaline phosphatase D-like protein